MSFVIEDAEDDDDDNNYSFQPKWGGGSGGGGTGKSYFGATDNDMDGGDEYNFDFGSSKQKKTKSPQSWKADKPDVRSSYSGSASASSATATAAVRSSVPSAGPVNVMDKAASMLAKYANPPQKRASQPPKKAMDFDIDNMSLDSSDDSVESRGHKKTSNFEMSFSPPEDTKKKKSVS